MLHNRIIKISIEDVEVRGGRWVVFDRALRQLKMQLGGLLCCDTHGHRLYRTIKKPCPCQIEIRIVGSD